MKYSVIIPEYNTKILLKNTLEALNQQEGYSDNDYEVIVVDDGSDDTYSCIKGINRNYNLEYFYLKRNKCSCRARARNYGWKKAKGEFIAFIDSDILVRNDYLKELDRYFNTNNNIFIIGIRIMLDKEVGYEELSSGNIFNTYKFDKRKYNLLEFRYFLYNEISFNANAIMYPWINLYSCNLAVPKKLLEEVGGFDENFIEWGIEDIEIGYSLYKTGANMVINSKLDVLHQFHGPRNDLIIEKNKVTGYEKNIKYFIEKHPKALKMPFKIACKFLKGEVSNSKINITGKPKDDFIIDFKDKNRLDKTKELILKVINNDNIRPIVNDYVENTDLDIWIQLINNRKNTVFYFPVSKKIDIEEMRIFIDNEKKQQKIRGGLNL